MLPTGTVTFLFTDIEGSTRLVQELGTARWTPVLGRHRELVRGALQCHSGHEVQTEGDSFFVVFEDPGAGLAAAVDAQRALAAEAWPTEAPIRVRMGLHTGEGVLDADGSYVGADVHRAARIAGAGHGGQVVVSSTVVAALADRLPDGVTLRDLREHRLKDLRPERLWDVLVDGLPSAFPPIRSLDVRPNNLPTQLTSFVGRDRELAEARQLLARTRLLTLTGPGGTGKTRLSLHVAASVADEFPGGTFFVALAPIRDPELVPATIARAIGISEDPARPTLDVLVADLTGRRVLLVLDNLEHLLDAVTGIAELLRRLPELSILATSRAALRISGEQEYQVSGLPTPVDPARLTPIEVAALPAAPSTEPSALLGWESVRLFVARARAVRPDFDVTPENAAAVAAICARLDGMPLAIELAAARVRLLTVGAILERLESQLDLLAAGARDLPERQRTLRGAIAWSHEILDEPQRRLFERAAVFAGGGRLSEIDTVCGLADQFGNDAFEDLGSLVDQSLLRVEEHGGEPRYVMLEPIREYALERLKERGEAEAVRERHARAYADLVERAARELAGREQRRWLDLLEVEHDNIRAALDWAIERPEPAVALRIASSGWRFWQKRGHLREARRRIANVLAQPWVDDDPAFHVRLLEAAGGVEYWHGASATATAYYDKALSIARELGDPAVISNALYNAALGRFVGGWSAPEALPMLDEALELARQAGDRHGEANVLWAMGTYRYFAGDFAGALPYHEQSHDLFPETGDFTMEAWSNHQVGIVLIKLGELDRAAEYLVPALRLFHEVGDLSGVTLVLDDLSHLAAARGDLPRSARLYGAARKLQATSGTDLARVVEEAFEQNTAPSAVRLLPADELRRYAREGAERSLEETVAYALEPAGAGAGAGASS
jgi:predicted ATPase/class 3 adenylate cyclase